MPQFYQTVLGRKFFEKQLPDLIRAAERIANALEEQNRNGLIYVKIARMNS